MGVSDVEAAKMPETNERKTLGEAKVINENTSKSFDDGDTVSGSRAANKVATKFPDRTKVISLAILKKFDGILKEKISILKKEMNKDNKEEGKSHL